MMDTSSSRHPSLPHVVLALSHSLALLRRDVGRPLTSHEIFAAMTEIASPRYWDAMPVAESVGAERLLWTGVGDQCEAVNYLLVTYDGLCFVEGDLPNDPVSAAEYLMIRRRYLSAHPVADAPIPGSPEAMRQQVDYDAMTDRVAEGLASLVPLDEDHPPTLH